jgi:hypothetical protein
LNALSLNSLSNEGTENLISKEGLSWEIKNIQY